MQRNLPHFDAILDHLQMSSSRSKIKAPPIFLDHRHEVRPPFWPTGVAEVQIARFDRHLETVSTELGPHLYERGGGLGDGETKIETTASPGNPRS